MRKTLSVLIATVLLGAPGSARQLEATGTALPAGGKHVLQVGGFKSWQAVFDSLASSDSAIAVFCNYPSLSTYLGQKYERPTVLEFANALDAARTLSAQAGYVVDTGTPGFWLFVDASGDSCPFPFAITGIPVLHMGNSQAVLGRSQQETLRRLFRLQERYQRLFRTDIPNLDSIMLYWPSREDGTEFYTLLSRDYPDRNPKYAPTMTLSRIKLGSEGTSAGDRLMWRANEVGPVADLLQDFNGDGVLDIVIYSTSEWSDHGSPPLRVLSGASGETIGLIDGYHVRLLRGQDGIHVLSRGLSGNIEYRVDYGEGAGKLLPVSHSKGKLAFRAPLSSETILDEFLISFPIANFDQRPYLDRVARILMRIGEKGSQDGLGKPEPILTWPGKSESSRNPDSETDGVAP
ncbi:MAG: hypothetical protein IT186_05735 [Acidobacteria bacterium]|nr:hypothetical protein [Acidobacteriota bacterium]